MYWPQITQINTDLFYSLREYYLLQRHGDTEEEIIIVLCISLCLCASVATAFGVGK
jgi:hypothetical protein